MMSNGYKPSPLDLSDIKLTPGQDLLVDKLAENAHNVWAKDRIKQGWTYGIQQVHTGYFHVWLLGTKPKRFAPQNICAVSIYCITTLTLSFISFFRFQPCCCIFICSVSPCDSLFHLLYDTYTIYTCTLCPFYANSPEPKDFSVSVINDKEKQKIHLSSSFNQQILTLSLGKMELKLERKA